jgi:hypothetical protein
VLIIKHPDFRVIVVLQDFCRKRGDAPRQRSLDDRQLADSLIDSLVMDQWPSAAVVVDFGIDSPDHLGALEHALNVGVTAYDFDRVLGDGRAITCLTRSLPRQPYPHVRFVTAYDGMAWDSEDASCADRSMDSDDEDCD